MHCFRQISPYIVDKDKIYAYIRNKKRSIIILEWHQLCLPKSSGTNYKGSYFENSALSYKMFHIPLSYQLLTRYFHLLRTGWRFMESRDTIVKNIFEYFPLKHNWFHFKGTSLNFQQFSRLFRWHVMLPNYCINK